jgi:hypothetical protein
MVPPADLLQVSSGDIGLSSLPTASRVVRLPIDVADRPERLA